MTTEIYRDYFVLYSRGRYNPEKFCATHQRVLWEGFVYMVPGEYLELFNLFKPEITQIGKSKWINRNGFFLVEKKKFEKVFPKAKKMWKNLEIYNNEDKFK